MKNLVLAGVAAAAMVPFAAQAAVTVSIYTDQVGAAQDATIDQAAGLTADATVSVGAINFATGNSDATTIGDFLNNPAGLSAGVAGHVLDNTYFLFTGSTYLHAGDNTFVVPHDDGVQLDIAGFGRVIDQPGPTAAVDSPFTVTATTAGLYSFTLAYGECCGGPAVLGFTVNDAPVGGTPEPGTWALMLAGFGLVGTSLRRRVKAVAA